MKNEGLLFGCGWYWSVCLERERRRHEGRRRRIEIFISLSLRCATKIFRDVGWMSSSFRFHDTRIIRL